ncbi:MAG: hypothetical protein ACOCVN_00345 [bacterium]
MKKYNTIIIAALFVAMLSTPGYSFLGGRDLTCGESVCLGCAILIVLPIHAIEELLEGISDSRTVSIDINGTKGVFQKNSVKWKDKKKKTIYSGNLVKLAEVAVQNHKIILYPGLVVFHDNGKINTFNGKGLFLTGNGREINCVGKIELFNQGLLKKGELTRNEPFNIQNTNREFKSFIEMDEKGNLLHSKLVHEETLEIKDYTVTLPASSVIYFYNSSTIRSIDPPFKNPVRLPQNNQVLSVSDASFSEKGNIMWCKLHGKSVINHKSFKLNLSGEVNFHENETIKSCTLSEPAIVEINTTTLIFSKYSKLEFYQNSTLKSGSLEKPANYNHRGITFKVKGEVSFYSNGSLKKTTLAESLMLQMNKNEIEFSPGKIRFYPGGTPLTGKIQSHKKLYYMEKPIFIRIRYSCELWFDRDKNIIAIENDRIREMNHNEETVIIPSYHIIGYNNYTSFYISFVSMYQSSMTLPHYIDMDNNIDLFTKIFVKAGKLKYKDEKLFADNIESIMFSDDTVIHVHNKEVLCPQMEWINLNKFKPEASISEIR